MKKIIMLFIALFSSMPIIGASNQVIRSLRRTGAQLHRFNTNQSISAIRNSLAKKELIPEGMLSQRIVLPASIQARLQRGWQQQNKGYARSERYAERNSTAPILGLTLIGAALHELGPEFKDESSMESFLHTADEDSKKSVQQKVLNNFEELIQSEDGCGVILALIDDPSGSTQSAELLEPLIVKHFDTLIQTDGGLSIICMALEMNCLSSHKFVKLVAEKNIRPFAYSKAGVSVLNFVLEKGLDDFVEKVVPFVEEEFQELLKKEKKLYFINSIIASSTTIAQLITPLCIENMKLILDTDNVGIFYNLILQNPDAAQQLAPCILQNLPRLQEALSGQVLIKSVLITAPDFIDKFEKKANEKTKQNICQIKKIIEGGHSLREVCSSYTTQTTQHFNAFFSVNAQRLHTYALKNKVDSSALHEMIMYVVNVEADEQQRGNYTFVHAYPWKLHFLQDIGAELRSIKFGQSNKVAALRFDSELKKSTLEKHTLLRRTLLSKGISFMDYDQRLFQKYSLSLNSALFCNKDGSNTLKYLLDDDCERPVELDLEQMFHKLDMKPYFDRYHSEFLELQKLHHEASNFGAGLVLSFTPEMLKHSVYVCNGNGRKRKVHIEGLGDTDDIQQIIDTLRKSPEKIDNLDNLEFVFVLTKDCALNHEVMEKGAYKTIPFNLADKQKLALYEQKRDALIVKIKSDLEDQRLALNGEELETWQDELQLMRDSYKNYNCLNADCNARLQEH